MSDDLYVDSETIGVIQETVDTVRQMNPFGVQTPLGKLDSVQDLLLRGYLMQGVSRGQQAACSIYQRQDFLRCFKIDLAGIIFEGLTVPSSFALRFYRKGRAWFDTDPLLVGDLEINKLLDEIARASGGAIKRNSIIGDLGHPTKSSFIVRNDELFPTAPTSYKAGDKLSSKIGSWVFGFDRKTLPEGFDVKLLFRINGTKPINLAGPAVMTLYEIKDSPTGQILIVTDVMEVMSPTPLRGGTRVTLGYFGDIGYGIIAANPREYLFTQQVVDAPSEEPTP